MTTPEMFGSQIKTWWVRNHVPCEIRALREIRKVGFYRVYFDNAFEWGLEHQNAVVDDFGNLVRVPS